MSSEIQNTKKIILSADSTCDLDTDLKERYHVNYFPLHIILNGKEYRDNIDITPEQVYQEYYDHKVLPKTAAVNAQEYIDHFRPWVEDSCEVIHINLGSALSSSYQNCCIAAEELGHVHVIDSCNLSTGTGLLVVAAGKMIEQGLDALSIAEALRAEAWASGRNTGVLWTKHWKSMFGMNWENIRISIQTCFLSHTPESRRNILIL